MRFADALKKPFIVKELVAGIALFFGPSLLFTLLLLSFPELVISDAVALSIIGIGLLASFVLFGMAVYAGVGVDALKAPFVLRDLAIGVALLFVPSLILLLITLLAPDFVMPVYLSIIFFAVGQLLGMPVLGFALKNAVSAAKDDSKKVSFSDFPDLFISGLLAMVISLVYLLPAIILFAIVYVQSPDLLDPALVETIELTATQIMIFFVGMLFALLAFYVGPAAQIEFGTGKFSDAFSFSYLLKRVLSLQYLLAWLTANIYSMLVLTVAMVLALLAEATVVLPSLILVIAVYICMITAFTLLGEAME